MQKSTRAIAAALGVAVAASALPGLAHGVFDPGARPEGHDAHRAEPWLKRSDAHRRRGDLATAWSDLAEAARLAPERSDLAYHRARLHLAGGDGAAAVRELERFLIASPDHVQGHATHARALIALGRHALAAEAFGRAIAVADDPAPDHYVSRARARLAAEANTRGLAIAELDAGIARLGPVPALVQEALAIERAGGRLDAALARIEREIARAREPVWWKERRADVLCDAGDTTAAQRGYREALALALAAPQRRRSTGSWRALETRLRQRGRAGSCVARTAS